VIPARWIVHLYAKLIRLYPRGFRAAFEDEMQVVFADAVAEAIERGGMSLIVVCLRELLDWPMALLRQHWLGMRDLIYRNQGEEEASYQIISGDGTPGVVSKVGGLSRRLAILLAGKDAKVRRLFDLACAALLLTAAAPLLLVIAVLIKVDSPGPVIFCQQRVGRNGRLFTLYKFRSMVCGADRMLVSRGEPDPRLTHVGRYIRKLYLDEYPTLFNVLTGDMSVFGPRPELPQ
jgi:hypothetical protein